MPQDAFPISLNTRKNLVGETGFEPATSRSQSGRSTRLSYSPSTRGQVSCAPGPVGESRDGRPSYPGGRGRAPCTIVRFLREAFMAGTTAPITWLHDLDEALAEAGRRDMHVLLD